MGRLGDHSRLHVDDHNRVMGSVNGHPCHVQLDSGAYFTFMFWSMAKRLSLINGTEATTKEEINLWIGPHVLDVVQLDSVKIDLGGGVVVITPATVFPKWLEPMYDAEDVVLDAHQLRRGGMVQVFRPGGSDLLVCQPEQLQRPARKTHRSVEPDVLIVRPAKTTRVRSKAMTVLVDTGAQGIHVSARRRKLLLKSRKGRRLPKHIVLDLGDGCCLKAYPLEHVASNDHDFIMGIDLLCRYGAVLNHRRRTLAFWVGSEWRQVKTRNW